MTVMRTLTLTALLLATTLAGCVSSQRFAAPAQQSQAVPQAAPQAMPQVPSGPYTREREDREFGQPGPEGQGFRRGEPQ
jgi:uncharacterized lipoprotein